MHLRVYRGHIVDFCVLLLILGLTLEQIVQGYGKRLKTGLEIEFWDCGGSNEGANRDCVLIEKSQNNLPIVKPSSDQPIIILTHGLLENVYDDEVTGRNSTWKFIKNAYQLAGFENFIFVKWQAIYVEPRRRKILQSSSIGTLAPVLRDRIANFITDLLLALQTQSSTKAASRLHLIGQDVGAHIMGSVGRRLLSESNIKVGRITGLDPTSPLFLTTASSTKEPDLDRILDAYDADFVDVVHTDTNGLGSLTSFGHVDWFVNGGLGSMQNGCRLPLQDVPFLSELVTIGCAHSRASALWAYAIAKQVHLQGCPCKKVTGRTTGKNFCKNVGAAGPWPCPGGSERAIRFGQYTSRDARGDYYLRISDATYEQLPRVWYQDEMSEAQAQIQSSLRVG